MLLLDKMVVAGRELTSDRRKGLVARVTVIRQQGATPDSSRLLMDNYQQLKVLILFFCLISI